MTNCPLWEASICELLAVTGVGSRVDNNKLALWMDLNRVYWGWYMISVLSGYELRYFVAFS